jgi:hypothetical protein
MIPEIEKQAFGWIQIQGHRYNKDIIIEQDGAIRKRRKKLSKAVYGTSHKISIAEAEDIYREGMETLLIGSGMFDSVRLSEEAENFFQAHKVDVIILPTGKAVQHWNSLQTPVTALFHITC